MSEMSGTHWRHGDRIADSQDALFEEGRSERVRILMASHRAEAALTAPAPARVAVERSGLSIVESASCVAA